VINLTAGGNSSQDRARTYSGNRVVGPAGEACKCSLRMCEGLAGIGSQKERGDHSNEVELKEAAMYSNGPSK